MANAHMYLLFNGSCEKAFQFYRSVFGGDFLSCLKYGDIPSPEGTSSLLDSDKNKIENIALPISQESILMGSDVIGQVAETTVFGNNFSIYLEMQNQEEASLVFNGLAQNGRITIPIALAHWGAYFGMLTDQFGVNWLINYTPKPE